MFWQQFLDFIQHDVTGKQIEEAVAITVYSICINTILLMFVGSVGNLHEDRLLLEGCWFGDLQPTTVPVFFIINSMACA
jgi:hypothetical protein